MGVFPTPRLVLAIAGVVVAVVLGTQSCSLTSVDELKGKTSSEAGLSDGPAKKDAADAADASACKPKKCDDLGAKCGQAPDGCAGVLDCGGCDESLFCGGAGPNKCGTTPCIPKSCAQL